MARVSAVTNPTDLKEIARKDVALSAMSIGDVKHVSLTRLDLSNYALPGDSPVILIARAGSTSNRFEIGTVNAWSRAPWPLHEIDPSAVLRFRLLVRDPNSTKLLASAENLRVAGDGDSESLLPIETKDLGQLMWRVSIGEDGPVLLCNQKVFTTGASAEGYVPFTALVLPEALRQILAYLAEEPEKLEEESGPWEPWGTWMEHLGLPRRPNSTDDEDKEDWIRLAIDRFCNAHRFVDQMHAHIEKTGAK